MSSVLLTTGPIVVTTIKHAVGNPSYPWANTYEIYGHGGALGSRANANALADQFMTLEAALHSENVVYERAVVRTWAKETGYDPNSFISRPAEGITGARALPGPLTALPRSFCLFVVRKVDTGKEGKLFYRGVLNESDLETETSLEQRLAGASSSAYFTLVSTLFNQLDIQVKAQIGIDARMSLVSKSGANIRDVTGFSVAGIHVNKPDHKYFDRAPAH